MPILNDMAFVTPIILSIFLLLAPTAQAANPQVVERVERYLQSLDQIEAQFTQTSPSGHELRGTFYLDRPGKLRFDYDGIDDFVVADGTFIYFYDSEIESQSHAPIGDTLANFLLRKDLTLSGDIDVQQAFKADEDIVITLTQTEEPEAGAITLFFDDRGDENLILREWIIRDAQKNLTRVALSKVNPSPSLDKGLFVYHDPKSGEPVYNE